GRPLISTAHPFRPGHARTCSSSSITSCLATPAAMKLAAACTSMAVKAKPARGGKRNRASSGTAAAAMILVEKKDSEKERRQRMKALCDKLASLIPKEHNPHADTMTQLGSLDVAASYIKKLKERVDELQHKKAAAQAAATLRGVSGISMAITTSSGASLDGVKKLEASAPVVEVRQPDDSSMEVRLICNTERPIKLHEVITILEEEGADIINANHSVVGHKIFYTIYSRVRINVGITFCVCNK
uniref:BHLH domain-containing protein n=1 Tax=Aegilops tauschii subsp. strangulata TaxID=200361 RepID=A0A453DN06_AEGTS